MIFALNREVAPFVTDRGLSEINLEEASTDGKSVLSMCFYYICISYIHLIFSIFFINFGVSVNYETATIIRRDNLRSSIIYHLPGK